MDCFQDFCLFCDRESHDGPYCTQACKLADLERSGLPSPASPSTSSGSRSTHIWTPSSRSAGLASSSVSASPLNNNSFGYTAPSSGYDGRRSQSSYFMWTASQQLPEDSPERSLTPSSSRTSLSSTTSLSNFTSNTGLSSQAKQDLHGYFNSFDQARAAKRRSSTR